MKKFTRMYILFLVCLFILTCALVAYANANTRPRYTACSYDVSEGVFVCEGILASTFPCIAGDDSAVFMGATSMGECIYINPHTMERLSSEEACVAESSRYPAEDVGDIVEGCQP